MPRGDGTGPLGEGPMTGWGKGNCDDANVSNRSGFGFGRGLGRGFGAAGRGFGRGLGWRWSNANQNQSEESYLKTSIDFLRNQLKALEDRLNGLKENR